MQVSGNTIFIPGATSGIGLGLARRFHEAGNSVIIAGRRQHLIDEILAAHPGMHGLVLDTSDAASIVAAAEMVQTRHPETNVLINMAGIMHLEDVHSDDFLSVAESTVATNLLGPIRLIGAFSAFLAKQPNAVIMNVSSGLAFVPLPFTPTYSATKAAIHSFTDAIRVQLADTGIQVIELVPPLVATALMNSEKNPHAMPLDEFLDEVMSLLESRPEADEILVERVKRQRFAVANGQHEEVLQMLSQR